MKSRSYCLWSLENFLLNVCWPLVILEHSINSKIEIYKWKKFLFFQAQWYTSFLMQFLDSKMMVMIVMTMINFISE